MSLINQMLQDLEKRRSEQAEEHSLPAEARAVAEASKPRSGTWLAVALVLVALIAVFAWQLQRAPSPSRKVALQPTLKPALPPAAKPVPEAAPQPPAPVAVPAAPAPVQPASEAAAPKEARKEPEKKKEPQAARKPKPLPAEISKQPSEPTPQQQAEEQYRRAVSLLQQGRVQDAQTQLASALQLDPFHVTARQALVGLLVEGRRYVQAERLLEEGLQIDPSQQEFAVMLARLQVERGDLRSALELLQRTLPYAENNPEYHAFMAALLQRVERHQEAAEQYRAALRLVPQSGTWWMGLGISLQADNQLAQAQEAFRRAKASNTLNPELQAFVDQRLRQIQQQLR